MDDDQKKKIIETLESFGNFKVIHTNDPRVSSIFKWFCDAIGEIEAGKKAHMICFKITPEGLHRFDIGGLDDMNAVLALLPYISEFLGGRTLDAPLH